MEVMDKKRIRNFSIIAHIDHGKSTLADRILELTGAVEMREMKDQFLDRLDIERERGITIKSQAVRLTYRSRNKGEFFLNLIDTPGHVDFNYEVSRSLAACEGAILLIDATQGIEAQTIANFNLAKENELVIIPVINKIDLPLADIDKVMLEIEETLKLKAEEVLLISAKEGIGIDEVLEQVIKRIPHPNGDENSPLKALIFDSHYDSYRGVIPYVRVFDGVVQRGSEIYIMTSEQRFEVEEVGIFLPEMKPKPFLLPGEVGYITANIKDIRHCQVGGTITNFKNKTQFPVPGYKKPAIMVYCSLFQTDSNKFDDFKRALERYSLNDASLTYEVENSPSLGLGFRCGFLGLLHIEIVQERLEREFGIELIATVPNVAYKVKKKNGEVIDVDNPTKMPHYSEIKEIEEPFVWAKIVTPSEYIGAIMKISEDRRGNFKNMHYISEDKVLMNYEFPLAEIIFDYFDKLKSCTKGYASLDYNFLEWRASDLVKVEIIISGKVVDALSIVTHRKKAVYEGRKMVEKLREVIPRQLFEVVIQASVDGRIIAREEKKPLRKDVTSKCYGGDITRKRKLLEKQKEGKKRMKKIGNVEIPQSAFLVVMSVRE